MNSETLKALQGSILKWEKIVSGEGVDMGIDNCPLCAKFFDKENRDTCCVGCPVMERTGKIGCNGLPYSDWALMHYDEIVKRNAKAKEIEDQLAVAELNFLKSLLP